MADHPPPESVNARLQRAMNAHDLEALVGCFDAEYLSDQPAHPNRAFRSPEGVRKHWSWFFENVPDFQAELVRTAIRGDTEWAEWRWHGTQRDASDDDAPHVKWPAAALCPAPPPLRPLRVAPDRRAEWRWHETQRDGRPFDVRGDVITGV